MIVADTSVLVPMLVSFTEADLRLREAIDKQELMAPAHVNLEVMSVLRKLCRRSILGEERAALALFDLGTLRIERVPTEALEMRIWELRHNLTSYDAAYVALAERMGVELWTRDQKLAGAPGSACAIKVFESS